MTLKDNELAALLAFLDEAADGARAAILPHFRAATAVDNKADSGFDPVTVADRAAESAIRALIAERFPKDGVIGEEFDDRPAESPRTWVIDPIDGTRAFITGLPTWGVLIGLCHEGAPILGLLDQPYLKERFVGFPGGATFQGPSGDRPLRVRDCTILTEATLSTTDDALFTPPEKGAFDQVRAAAKLTRLGLDCYAYGMLAMGGIDLVIESGLKPVDILPLIPIIEGAGGIISDWRGNPVRGGGQAVAAASKEIRDEAMVALRRSAR
jgi:histidinol phosphatase-like enzyme (inositol monophosphatase family)